MRAECNILCWQGYDSAELLGPFAARCGVTTRAQTLVSDFDTASRLARGEVSEWDVLNINNAYIRDYLYPRNLVRELNDQRFQDKFMEMLPQYKRLFQWAYSGSGKLLGICQRFGPFNLVVDTRRVDRASAEDQGFELANDPRNKGRYGILNYDDFNLFHICIGAGVDPFLELDNTQFQRVHETAASWYENAARVEDDHLALNQALIGGDIDFYISGGIYTAAIARLAGYSQIRAVTPKSGPMKGLGGIVFAEITSVLNHPEASPAAEDFLHYLLQDDVAIRIAFSHNTCNPVAQMGSARVFSAFTKKQLEAIQWESLEEDIARCVDYQIMPDHSRLLAMLESVRQTARP